MGNDPAAAPSRAAPTDPAQVVQSAWQDQDLWSTVATQMADSIRRWRVIAAVAGVAGLFLTVLAGVLGTKVLGGQQGLVTTVGVLLLALVPYIRQKMLAPERLQAWVRARNVSELLKEAIYRHLMGALPVDTPAEGTAPEATALPAGPATLARRCRAVKQAAADLAGLAAATTPLRRERPSTLTLDDYVAQRVDGQIGWYKKKGEEAGQSARRLHAAEFLLGLAAVGLGALSGQQVPEAAGAQAAQQMLTVGWAVPWLTLVAAAASAVTAHIAAARLDELAGRYYATYDLLKGIRDEWLLRPDHQSPAQVQRFVDEVERSITAENGAWVTDWSKPQQG